MVSELLSWGLLESDLGLGLNRTEARTEGTSSPFGLGGSFGSRRPGQRSMNEGRARVRNAASATAARETAEAADADGAALF